VDMIEHLLEVERRAGNLTYSIDDVKLSDPPLALAKQAYVLDRDGRLIGKDRERLDRATRRALAVVWVIDRQQADQLCVRAVEGDIELIVNLPLAFSALVGDHRPGKLAHIEPGRDLTNHFAGYEEAASKSEAFVKKALRQLQWKATFA